MSHRSDFLTLTSFGYLHSDPPAAATRVVDVREILRDPARVSGLLDLTGQDPAVRTAVLETPGARPLLHELFVYAATLPPHMPAEIAIGCAGGRHRSVALVEILAEMLHDIGQAPRVQHQHMHLPRVLTETEFPEAVLTRATRFADHWLLPIDDEHLVVLGHPGQRAALQLVDAWTGDHVHPDQLLYTDAVLVRAPSDRSCADNWTVVWDDEPTTVAASRTEHSFPVTVWSPAHQLRQVASA